ncbi:MAG: hypothetical protein ACP5UM_08960 [Anaerolineae bacterium]
MEPRPEKNWGPFVAGLLIVVGLGLCLSTAALAWWWTRPKVELGLPPVPVASPPAATVLPRALTPGGRASPAFTPAAGRPVPPQGPPGIPSTPVPTAVPQPQGGGQPPLLVEDFSLFGASGVLDALLTSPAGRPVRVVVREETLNRDLAYLAEIAKAEQEVHMDPVTVELRPEGVYVSGEAKVGFLRGRYQVLAEITVQGCTPRVKVRELRIGGLPAPEFLRQQLEDEVARSLDLWLQGLPLCIEQVLLERGRGVVVGHR